MEYNPYLTEQIKQLQPKYEFNDKGLSNAVTTLQEVDKELEDLKRFANLVVLTLRKNFDLGYLKADDMEALENVIVSFEDRHKEILGY